jgi:hypothetical protein
MTDEETRYQPMDGADTATGEGDARDAVDRSSGIDPELAAENAPQGDVGEAREGADEQQVVVDTEIDA